VRGVAWQIDQIERALALIAEGLSDYEVARRTAIPRSTILNWRRGHLPSQLPSGASRTEQLEAASYAYLLGQYLGDGCLFRNGKQGYGLRISSDAAYVEIIDECCRAIEQIRGRRPYVYHYRGKRLATITSYWMTWPILFPQHGPGRKHHRTIALAPWQVELVEAEPGRFLRGLIHSDGWRGLNRVHVKGRDYAYPRYQFSSRSDDIRQLFVYGCELLGIAWRPWGRYHISVARRESVALLDEHVGQKR
jgi:hypothetical protein